MPIRWWQITVKTRPRQRTPGVVPPGAVLPVLQLSDLGPATSLPSLSRLLPSHRQQLVQYSTFVRAPIVTQNGSHSYETVNSDVASETKIDENIEKSLKVVVNSFMPLHRNAPGSTEYIL